MQDMRAFLKAPQGFRYTARLTFLNIRDIRAVKRPRVGEAQCFTEQRKPSRCVTKRARRDKRTGVWHDMKRTFVCFEGIV